MAALAPPPSFAQNFSSRRRVYSTPSKFDILTSVFAEENAVANFQVERDEFALFALPAPTAMTSPAMGFSFAESGMMIPLLSFFFFNALHE